MKELLPILVSFLLGLLSHIIYGAISNSRSKKRIKNSLSQEIQSNFFQVRDGREYSKSRINELTGLGRHENVVIMSYNFNFNAYEDNINDIPLLKKDVSLKIHHFYNRLKTLQDVAKVGLQLFEKSKELTIDKENIPRSVKVIDASSLSSHFFQILDDYRQFETEAFNIGNELVSILGK